MPVHTVLKSTLRFGQRRPSVPDELEELAGNVPRKSFV
jgi:hypothetical protein